ncbi:MAG TPA: TAXI family TRAP transporter solute-binding subunit [Methylomirabilota bacterium]|nr:TAXI family TRAP transporter solute-binding subunit [Methylomirabilota bacterium]
MQSRTRSLATTVVGLVLMTLLLGLTLAPGTPDAQQRKPVTVTSLRCPIGCGVTEGDTILGSFFAKEHPWLVYQSQETPGYMYNIREMAKNNKRWTNTIFGTEDTVIQLGSHGGRPELKEFLPDPIKIKWKLLFGEAWWTQGMWYVTLDPKLKTIADLKGKRLGLGLRTQSDWGMDARVFLDTAYGITPANTNIQHLGPVAAAEAMLDGKVDAVVMGMGTDPFGKNWLLAAPMRLLEASGRKLYYIGMDKDAPEKVNARYGTTYMTITVPPGTLPQRAEPLVVGVDRGYLASHPELPEEVGYEIVKTVAKLYPRMTTLNALWKVQSPELMVNGLTEENAHPGAMRAYKELGWWEHRTKFPAVTYPK